MRAVPALVALVALAGCADPAPRTEVVVIVDAEPLVRARASELELRVRATASLRAPAWEDRLVRTLGADGGALDWPITLGVVPRGGRAERGFEVTATARSPDEELGRVRARSSFVAHETRSLYLVLEDGCVDAHAACGDTETCRAAACVDDTVPPADLGPYPVHPPALDAGMRDAQPADLGEPDDVRDLGPEADPISVDPSESPTPPTVPWLPSTEPADVAAADPGVVAPAPPAITPCPEGWRVVPGGGGVPDACDPWPEDEPEPAPCADDEARWPGASCSRLGPACPVTDDFATDLPADGTPIVFVRAGAPVGGNGTRASPFATASEALRAIGTPVQPTVVALSIGAFDGPVVLPPSVTLWGACVAGTTVRSDPGVDDAAVAALGSAGVAGVRDLRVEGGPIGLAAEPGSALDAVDVVVEVDDRPLLARGGSLSIDRVHVLGASADVEAGGSMTVRHAELERTGVSVYDGDAIVEDAWFHGGGRVALGAFADADVTAAVTGARVLAEDIETLAESHGSRGIASVERSVARRLHGDVVSAAAGGTTTARRTLVSSYYLGGGIAIEGSTLLLEDYAEISHPGEGPLAALSSDTGARVTTTRAVFVDPSGFPVVCGAREAATLSLEDTSLVVRSPRYPLGAAVRAKRCELSATRVELRGWPSGAVQAEASTVTASDLTIRDCARGAPDPFGIRIVGSGADLERVAVRGTDGPALDLRGASDGSPATVGVTDLALHGDGADCSGIAAADAATLDARAVLIAGMDGAAIAATRRSSAAFADLVVTDAAARGRAAIDVSDGSTLVLERAAVLRSSAAAIRVAETADGSLCDVLADGVSSRSDVAGFGILARGVVTLERVALRGTAAAALAAAGVADVRGTDLRVGPTGGRGLELQGGRLTLDRVLVEGARALGAGAFAGRAAVSNLALRGTAMLGAGEPTSGALVSESALMVLTDFEVTANGSCGLTIWSPATFEGTRGRVSGHEADLCGMPAAARWTDVELGTGPSPGSPPRMRALALPAD